MFVKTSLILITIVNRKKNAVEPVVVQKIKKIQAESIKNWKGMEVNFIGRPGYSTILNSKKKTLKADHYLELEDKRLRSIYKGIVMIKELEDEKLGISGVTSKQNGDIVNFKLIKESQLIKEGPVPLTYSKN